MTGPMLSERIRAGDKLLGGLLRMPNPYLTELCGLHGMDFVVFDCEHGPGEIALLHQHVLVARAYGLDTLVRLPGSDPDTALRALDAGAAGLVVPRVSTTQQAQAVVASATYPPGGSRGFATYTPAGRYGLTPAQDHLADAARRRVIIAMIEDDAAVSNAAAISAVDGITGLLVGPADLAVASGLPGQTAHEQILRATGLVHAAARGAGRAVMVIAGGPGAASSAFATGAQLVLCNVAQALNEVFAALAATRPSTADAPGGAYRHGDETVPT
jgi:4-hydroxy-2-oxoheptanedioate aldolase